MATLVELINGEFVHSDAEAWRHQTEAAQILRMPLEHRRAHLAAIDQRRGFDAAEALRKTMAELWAKARAGT